MSFKSLNSKGRLDLQTMLEDFEDLDYEPDLVEQEEENDSGSIQLPEPSGQEFQESSSNNTSLERQSDETDLECALAKLQSFRDGMNYMNLHVDIEKDSCRSKFASYSNSKEIYHLDSSDEEDVDNGFSDLEYDQNDYEVSEANFGIDDEEDCVASTVSFTDLNYVGTDSHVNPKSSLSCEQAYESDNTNYENMINPNNLIASPSTNSSCNVTEEFIHSATLMNRQRSLSNDSTSSQPKKSLNFTVQVTSGLRICVNAPKKKKRRPWLSGIKNYLPNIILLSSLDDMIQFCPRIKHRNSSSSLCSTESQRSVFKVPLKRPPTHQKLSFKNLSVSVDQRGTMIVKDPEDNYDVISLIASTSIEGDQEDTQECCNIEVKSEAFSSSGTLTDTQTVKMNRIAEWVQKTNTVEVPSIYKGLCYNYFFYNNCRNQWCINSHLLISRQTNISQMQYLSEDDFNEAYNFAKSTPRFCKKIYKVFAKIFGIKDNKVELMNMVPLIFDENIGINKIEGLRTIVENLQKTDLETFECSVDHLLLQVGLGTFPMLGELLIEIIISMNTLPGHWSIVGRLFKAGVKIPLKLASQFLVSFMQDPIDIKVCQEVYKHILKYKCLDLQSVPSDIRDTFVQLCTLGDGKKRSDKELEACIAYNLNKEKGNIETAKPDDEISTGKGTGSEIVSIIPKDFFVPPPNYPIFTSTERVELERPISIRHPAVSTVESLNFMNTDSSIQQDFVPSSGQQLNSNASNSNLINEDPCANNRNDTVPEYLFSRPPPRFIVKHNLSQSNKYNSSEDGKQDSKRKLSDSQLSDQNHLYFNPSAPSTSRQSNTNYEMIYSRKGLHYDPTKDYVFSEKKGRKRSSIQIENTEVTRSITITSNVKLLEGDTPKEGRGNERPNLTGSSSLQKLPKPKQCLAFDSLVSSSSDLQSRKEKPPEHPVFGKLYFDPNYELNVSLHNLYLQKIDNIDIDELDVHRLNMCVKSGNGPEFLELVNKYCGPITVQNFISMTLAHLKGLKSQFIAKTFMELIESIERHNPYYYGSLKIRVVLEVLTMNLLFELEKRNMFKAAKDLLIKFSNWDSLITSRLFITDIQTEISIVGRYMFIAKMLVFTKPELTYEILICPTFHFLEEYQKWPYQHLFLTSIVQADLEARNVVLTIFLKTAFRLNALVVIQLYKTSLRKNGGIWGFDVRPFLNQMMVEFLNQEYILPLKQIQHEITYFINVMERDTLRAFLIIMSKFLSKADILNIFEKCVARNIYQQFVKDQMLEYVIEIKTNMHEKEIEVLILYYFHKLEELRNIPPGSESLKFEIKLPGEFKTTDLLVLNTNKSLHDVMTIIRRYLKNCSLECNTVLSNVVEVEKDELIRYLENITVKT